MKNRKLFIFISVILLIIPVTAQKNTEKTYKTNQTFKSIQLSFEKAYLSFDRPCYFSGEDIWFKVFLLDAQLNQLSDNSNCLYVELISPLSEILQRHVIHLKNGLGQGDFHLNDSLTSGKYQVRAYTNWMRNFEDYFFFTKEINIENINGIIHTRSESLNIVPEVDVQFFPEGGSLIEDVVSIVGFKAVNSLGKSCEIKGAILSSAGDTAAKFTSTHLGMGSFNFSPKKSVEYFASVISEKGAEFRVRFPLPLPTGYVIKVTDSDKNNFMISIKTNQQTLSQKPTEEMNIIASSNGKLYFASRAVISSIVKNFKVPKKFFPEGIVRFTLLDNEYKPHCERLAFAEREQQMHLTISSDKKVYAPREKVVLKVSVRDSSDNHVYSNLSLSAVEQNPINENEKNMSNINSYFLLESEIHGMVEQPSYYFDTGNTNRIKALNLLLLTQGWRDFIWKHVNLSISKPAFLPENGITISGRLRKILIDKPIADATITLGVFGTGNPDINYSQTDSTGNFSFSNLNIFGEKTLVASAIDKKNDLKGLIMIDSLFNNHAPVTYYWKELSETQSEKSIEIKKQAEYRYNTLKKYRLSDTVLIGEVIITAKKGMERQKDDHFRIYGEADNVIEVTDQMKIYSNIFDILRGKVAGLSISGEYPNYTINIRGASSLTLSSEPLFLIDGFTSDIQGIFSIPTSEIDKIEIVKSGGNLAMFGMNGSGGVISIFTKHGSAGSLRTVFHTVNKKINGFYEGRTFYSPKYDVPKPEYEKPDFRNTVFWEPDLITDTAGNTTISFFNADNNAIICVRAEGISESGKLIFSKAYYEVRK